MMTLDSGYVELHEKKYINFCIVGIGVLMRLYSVYCDHKQSEGGSSKGREYCTESISVYYEE